MSVVEPVNEVLPAANAQVGADPYKERTGRQWWLVVALTFAAIMAVIDRTILSLLFDPVKQDMGFTDTQMAMVFGFAFAIANVLFTLPAGFLADRISRRGLIATGAVVWSIMTSTCGIAANFWQLLLARAGVGFAEGVIHPCSFSMLRTALPSERRGRGFAVYGMSLMVGSALGFIVGGVLIKIMSNSGITELPLIGEVKPWRLVMLTLGVVGLPFALLMATIWEPARQRGGEQQGSIAEALGHMKKNWKVYVPLLIYSATLSMQSNAYGAFVASIPLRRWDIPVSQVGATLGLMMLFAAPIGLWVTGIMMDKLTKTSGRRGPALVGVVTIFLVFLSSAAAPIAPTPFWFYVLACGVFLVGGTGFAITGNLISMVTPSRNMGKTSAVQLFVYGIVGMGSGPAIVGAVSDNFFPGKGGIGPAMSVCCGVFTLVSFLAMCILFFTIGTQQAETE
ncbi:MAG: MFS transporter [Steroidobacteraceae bacterium]